MRWLTDRHLLSDLVNELRARSNARLLVDIRVVKLDRLLFNEEQVCDLFIAEPPQEVAGYFAFSRTQFD